MNYDKTKFSKVMHEFKMGSLHSGRAPRGKKKRVVKDRKQAVAIAMNEARRYALEKMAKGK